MARLLKKFTYGVVTGGVLYYTLSGRLKKDVTALQESLREVRESLEEALYQRHSEKAIEKWGFESTTQSIAIMHGVYWNEMLRRFSKRLTDEHNPMDSLKLPVSWKDIQHGFKLFSSSWIADESK
jgi:hypothetical protein